MNAWLDQQGIIEQKGMLRHAAAQAFYNTSKLTHHDLGARADRQQLRADFEDYPDGFSPNVEGILDNSELRNQIPRLSKADALGSLIDELTSPDINVSPVPVMDTDGTDRHSGLDNHAVDLLRQVAKERGKQVSAHLCGQAINAETSAICRAEPPQGTGRGDLSLPVTGDVC